MTFSELCIRRPIMTTLVMAAILLFGIMGYRALPVSELPNVDFPTISVSANLPGASPETMASAVAKPLENQFSNINGIDSMTSTSARGTTRITLQFALDRNIDAAAQDVQAAISATLRQLPIEMNTPPSYRKVNPADAPILFLALSSDTLPLSQVDDYAETMLAQRISTVSGVAQVSVFGSQKFAVRIQVDPEALAARGIGFNEVADAVRAANVNHATGSLSGATNTMTVDVPGQLMNAASFRGEALVYRHGAPVRFEDVATVVDSVENTKVASWYNNHRAVVLSIDRQPGSNTIAVVDAIRQILPSFEQTLPASVKLDVLYDRSQSIRASVQDVQFTLLLAAALVVMVIFLFLRNLSATLIPSVALPISVIGTFAVMYLLGYSLDNLSLMALTLSVGFVVDDAIVMLENIMRHIEEGESPLQAALKGSREIGFTILSMTVSLSAVFIPVLFMGGIVGRLLHEFAVTLVAAIFVSGFVSLTLTPMLSGRFIKANREHKHGRLYWLMERVFDKALAGYDRTLRLCLAWKPLMLVVFVLTVAGTAWLFTIIPKSFLPSEDTGRISVQTQGSPDASFAAMVRNQQQLAAIAMADPNVGGVMSSVGSGGASSGESTGTMLLSLKPLSQRTQSADQIIQTLMPKMAEVPGIRAFLQNPPAINIGGRSTTGQYQYTLQGLDLTQLFDWGNRMQTAIANIPGLQGVASDADRIGASLVLQIDRSRAAALGISADEIQTVLGSAFGAQQISTIYTQLNQYEVILEVIPRFQGDPGALSRMYLRSSGGQLVPLDTLVNVSRRSAPLTINHSGQLPSVTISFNLAPGVTIGTAINDIHAVEQQMRLPDGITSMLGGTAQAFQSSMQGIGLLFVMAVLVVYIILGILYESFIHPLTILSGLPSAGFGALLTLLIFHVPLSLYAFVGIIMLVGIVKKNAIMMIDFALVRQRRDNLPAAEAIHDAALVRFRPIMMTTMAALVGTLPIAIGFGAGGETRTPLGLAVVGGLLFSQVLTLYLTPVIYIYLDRLSGTRKTSAPIPAAAPAE